MCVPFKCKNILGDFFGKIVVAVAEHHSMVNHSSRSLFVAFVVFVHIGSFRWNIDFSGTKIAKNSKNEWWTNKWTNCSFFGTFVFRWKHWVANLFWESMTQAILGALWCICFRTTDICWSYFIKGMTVNYFELKIQAYQNMCKMQKKNRPTINVSMYVGWV